MKHFSWLWFGSLACAVMATGCGLVLDTQPRDSQFDSGTGEQDGGQQDGDVPQCFIDDDCPDVNVCDGRETCVEGRCVGTDAIMNCADEFACTDDTCDPQLGCVFRPVHDRCANGGVCFADMGCSTTQFCQEADDCGEQAACLGLTCDDGFCRRGEPLVCPDDGCLVGGCFNGGCVYAPNSGRCPRVGPCLESTCQLNGECSELVPNDDRCDDGIDCTIDECVGGGQTGSSCSNIPDHEFCDDGVACTYNFCAPGDPSADVIGSGCAMRLVDSICADAGGFEGCVSPVCLPSGCDHGVTITQCGDGGICSLDTGDCVFEVGCDACSDLANPCAPTTCDANDNSCRPPLLDPCATTLPGFIGYCNTSGSEPRCEVRPNPQTLPPISIGLPVLP